MVRIRVVALPAPSLQVNELRKKVRGFMLGYGQSVLRKDFEATWSTWRTKPTYEFTFKIEGKRAELKAGPGVKTRSATQGNKQFVWLDLGTRIRWAVMSPHFRPKTQPGRLRAGRGRAPYDPRYRGKKALTAQGIPPQPGIKPRGFSLLILDKNREPFRKGIKKIVREWKRSAWRTR